MNTARRIITSIVNLFHRLTRRTGAAAAKVGQPAVGEQLPAVRKPKDPKRRRRGELRALLGRLDNGTRHYGSKRKAGRVKYGKRSGRQ